VGADARGPRGYMPNSFTDILNSTFITTLLNNPSTL